MTAEPVEALAPVGQEILALLLFDLPTPQPGALEASRLLCSEGIDLPEVCVRWHHFHRMARIRNCPRRLP